MNITRKRGDTIPDVFLISKGGIATNLTGTVIKLTVDKHQSPIDSSTQVYQLVGTVSDPTTGKVCFTPSPSQADVVGYFYYDIQMTDSYNSVQTILDGTYTYLQDITK